MSPQYDDLVFKNFRLAFGGSLRLLISGSAPIAKDTLDFFRIVLSCPVLEGYGQTEGSALEFCQYHIDTNSSGHVGGPMINVEFKIRDVPEMGYTSEDKDENG